MDDSPLHIRRDLLYSERRSNLVPTADQPRGGGADAAAATKDATQPKIRAR